MYTPTRREILANAFRAAEKTGAMNGNDLMPQKTVGTPTSRKFGGMLRAQCEKRGVTRDKFLEMASAKFPDLNDVTPARWWEGEKLPQKDFRGWFSETFGVQVPNKRKESPQLVQAPATDLMEFAVGSLQTAIKSSDAQILHDVKDSLKDPVQNPWMRIAVTLVRQAHLRR